MKVVKYTSSWMVIKLTILAAIDTDFIRYCNHDDALRKKEMFENTKIDDYLSYNIFKFQSKNRRKGCVCLMVVNATFNSYFVAVIFIS